MLVKDRKRHHEELIRELEDVILEEKYIEKDKSPYLIDYLYGYSDIDKEVNEFLDQMKLNEKWVVFYRCLLNLEFINGKYDKYRNIGKNIFLIRNENDFEKWEKFINYNEHENMEEKVDTILQKLCVYVKDQKNLEIKEVEDLFLCSKIKNNFRNLLKRYVLEEDKQTDSYKQCIFEIDTLLGGAYKEKKIKFTKTDFFTEILDINKCTISSIQKSIKNSDAK